MKKALRRVSAVLLAAIMLVGTLGTVAFAEEASASEQTELSWPHLLARKDSSQYNFTITADYNSYFQHELPALPDGAVVTSAKLYLKASGFDSTSKSSGTLKIRPIEVTTRLEGSFEKSDITSYPTTYDTTIEAKISSSTVNKTFDDWTDDFAEADLTDVIKKAYEEEDTYFTYIAKIDNGYYTVSKDESTKQKPFIAITYKTLGSLAINNLTDGKITAYDSTNFDISATVVKGSADISSVVLTITDAEGDSKNYSEPEVSGDNYTWIFSGGLVAGEYTAKVTVTYADGETLTQEAAIEVISAQGTELSWPHLMAKSGSSAYNFTIEEGKVGYFQHELPVLPEGAVVTSAKLYAKASAFNTGATKLRIMPIEVDTKLEGSFDKSDTTNYPTTYTEMITATIADNTVSKTFGDWSAYDFVEADITAVIKTAYKDGDTYFTYMADVIGSYFTVSKAETKQQPIIEITYEIEAEETVEPLENHVITTENGTAAASVTVNEGSAVLIVAAYNGTTLIDAVIDSTVENNQLTATLTNTTEGVTFRSFVWSGLSTMVPLLPAK